MRPKGNKLSYADERAEELYRAYKAALPRCIKKNGMIDENAAIAAAIATPCSRYWISEGVASIYIQRIKKDASVLDTMYPQKRLLYQSLFSLYKKMREDPSYASLNDVQVAYLASDSPAPSFFMSLGSARQIIHHQRKIHVAKSSSRKVSIPEKENE